jgi:hypothetical protein
MDKMQKPPHILLMTPPKTKKKSKQQKMKEAFIIKPIKKSYY